MQFDTQETYGTRTYADMHGQPTTGHKEDKTPLQALLDGMDRIMSDLRRALDNLEEGQC